MLITLQGCFSQCCFCLNWHSRSKAEGDATQVLLALSTVGSDASPQTSPQTSPAQSASHQDIVAGMTVSEDGQEATGPSVSAMESHGTTLSSPRLAPAAALTMTDHVFVFDE